MAHTGGNPAILTMGVEEEFLLVDARTLALAETAELVLAKVDDGSGTAHLEATRQQIEAVSPVAHTAAELRAQLFAIRCGFTEAAAAYGCRLVASGTAVLPGPTLLVDAPRRHEQRARYGALTDTLVHCGCHVHVGTLDLDTAVEAVNHVRPWLPTLIAVGANSPFRAGRDTGHASWRAAVADSWPAGGLPPRLDSVAHYRSRLATLVASGAAMDAKMLYWDARPSATWPTLEVRAPDVSPDLDETVLYAVLARALVATALRAIAEGRPAPGVRDEVLALARWRAARDGLDGEGLDPYTGTPVPAFELLDALVAHTHPELLAAGDLAHVTESVAALRRNGGGARRQRAAYERRHDFTDVVRRLADATECRDG
ncbi:carboxylate-amine ligase [Embleya sp. AB8]|uniref:carboxylate-amine ligase n=1 Tax=Embleya sp. AB8 TaxID=3156304 RepID=UPI003C7553B2